MAGDSPLSFKITVVSVIWRHGYIVTMTGVSTDFHLMFLTFKDICSKVASVCVLLLAETEHLCGRKQAQIHSESGRPLENRINYLLHSPSLLKFSGMLKKFNCCFVLGLENLLQKFISKKQLKGTAKLLPFCP